MGEMETLVQKLNEASDAYYNGREIMSDHEFDALVGHLQELEAKEGRVLPSSPTRTVGAPAVDILPKFKHPYPALSLDKTKSEAEMQKRFIDGLEAGGIRWEHPQVVCMYKMDGSTGQAYYNHGKLQRFVTRGNGEIGSDVTHNAKSVQNVPLEIDYPHELVVRGEVVMSYDDFKEINSTLPEDQQYKNPRNLAAASLSLLDSAETARRRIAFVAFNLVRIPEVDDKLDDLPEGENNLATLIGTSFNERLKFLDRLGFVTVTRELGHVDQLQEMITFMTEEVPSIPYPVDGLVLACDYYKYTSTLQGTEHHPHILSGYAYKWADEAVETTLREIEWSPSRTGLLNPVAIFDPVELYGTTVSRASLHNVSILRDMKVHVGDTIAVTKSNMVIPYIVENLSADSHTDYTLDELMELVGYCPTCGEKVGINQSKDGILTAFCPNVNCPEKLIGKLAHFCTRDCMNIEGMSEETIKKLVDAGFIKEYSDFFNLCFKPEIQHMPGFGKVSWDNMCAAARKAKDTTFVRFITALSIPNIGKGQAKTLYNYLSENYDSLCDLVGADKEEFAPVQLLRLMITFGFDFSVIDGFGDIMAKGLSRWLKDNMGPGVDSPETRVLDYMTFTDERKVVSNEGSTISGKAFCITGKLINYPNREALVAVIEEHGGKFVSSVSSKTDYLINNDTTSTSGKNKKAKEIGIPIISEADFMTMIQ